MGMWAMDSYSACAWPLTLKGRSTGRSRASFSDSTASSNSRPPCRACCASMVMPAAGVDEWTPASEVRELRGPLCTVNVRHPLTLHRQDPGFSAARDQRASIATGACCTECGAAAMRIAGRGAIRRTLGDGDGVSKSQRILLCTGQFCICGEPSADGQCAFD